METLNIDQFLSEKVENALVTDWLALGQVLCVIFICALLAHQLSVLHAVSLHDSLCVLAAEYLGVVLSLSKSFLNNMVDLDWQRLFYLSFIIAIRMTVGAFVFAHFDNPLFRMLFILDHLTFYTLSASSLATAHKNDRLSCLHVESVLANDAHVPQ